jgi:hypothetical protein
MAEFKCEFPEGCRLDLWASVIKSKFIEKQCEVLDNTFCVPEDGPDGVKGKIEQVDDIKVKVREVVTSLNFNKVKIHVRYEVVLFTLVNQTYQIITVTDSFDKTIELDEFDPPLTAEQFRNDVREAQVVLNNWDFDYEIKGACEDPCSPCYCNNLAMVPGTCLRLVVYVDINVKLTKSHDIVVYGELD